ncbi:extensin [Iris pallida]|uniref:Extensin n=1 Tax=Iris pallida TaxID=29817 RepID=A0AAX6GHZ7_IRIPA|nr:extensin [Iris pallida]
MWGWCHVVSVLLGANCAGTMMVVGGVARRKNGRWLLVALG